MPFTGHIHWKLPPYVFLFWLDRIGDQDTSRAKWTASCPVVVVVYLAPRYRHSRSNNRSTANEEELESSNQIASCCLSLWHPHRPFFLSIMVDIIFCLVGFELAAYPTTTPQKLCLSPTWTTGAALQLNQPNYTIQRREGSRRDEALCEVIVFLSSSRRLKQSSWNCARMGNIKPNLSQPHTHTHRPIHTDYG